MAGRTIGVRQGLDKVYLSEPTSFLLRSAVSSLLWINRLDREIKSRGGCDYPHKTVGKRRCTRWGAGAGMDCSRFVFPDSRKIAYESSPLWVCSMGGLFMMFMITIVESRVRCMHSTCDRQGLIGVRQLLFTVRAINSYTEAFVFWYYFRQLRLSLFDAIDLNVDADSLSALTDDLTTNGGRIGWCTMHGTCRASTPRGPEWTRPTTTPCLAGTSAARWGICGKGRVLFVCDVSSIYSQRECLPLTAVRFVWKNSEKRKRCRGRLPHNFLFFFVHLRIFRFFLLQCHGHFVSMSP